MKKPDKVFKFVIKIRNNQVEIWTPLLHKSICTSISQPTTITITGKGTINLDALHNYDKRNTT